MDDYYGAYKSTINQQDKNIELLVDGLTEKYALTSIYLIYVKGNQPDE